MTDRIKICDVVDSCEECPRYGNDCDGGGDAEVNETKSPYMQQSRHDDGRMTREEAIKILEEEAEFLYGGDEPYNKIAFDMAIEALSQPIVAKCYEIEKDYIYCSPETAEVVCNALHLYHSTNVQNMHNADLISRADAINTLETEKRCTDREEDVSGLTLAKLLISALPSADAVPHGRLIDADSLISDLEEWKENPNNDDSSVDLVNHFIGIIRSEPSADAVQGEWVRKYDDKINCYWYECDQCGEYRPRNQFGKEYNANFCPNCGARMENTK